MNPYKILLFALVSVTAVSCKKDWLKVRSNKSMDVPNTLEDYQALLDNTAIMNEAHPSLGEVSADNYYIPYATWNTWTAIPKSAYVWAPDIYSNTLSDVANWNNPYRQVFYANIVLDGLDEVKSAAGMQQWNNAKGSALFYRAEGFFWVSQIFTRPYSLTFPDNAGIPLRLNSDPNQTSVRAGLQETYQQVLSDLLGSLNYLPTVPLYKTRPSKPAAYALLSRVYLVMQDYSNAMLYADSCLKLYDSVLDYNTLKSTMPYPILPQNKEVIYLATMDDPIGALGVNAIVDSNLYKSYDNNDLRKTMFYKLNASGLPNFIGTYTGGALLQAAKGFGGIATDEVYLTRAECLARSNNISAAMSDLNKLMAARWKNTVSFVPFTANNQADAITLILQERRKETPFRGLRWPDLRRLNSEGANITLTRNLNGQQYVLPPNDPKYALPIPPDAASLSGMTQNER